MQRLRMEKEFSVFVHNIPTELDPHGLRGIFQKARRVSDTYIPYRRTRRNNARYGFVRFRREDEANRSISLLNNAVIRGRIISVSRARNEKRSPQHQYNKHPLRERLHPQHKVWKRKNNQQNQVWRRVQKQKAKSGVRNAYTGVTEINEECQLHKIALEGILNEEFTEWLARSLVCTTEEPRDLATLASAINSGFGLCSKICALSSLKFILTFPTMAQMEESLNNHEELDIWFNNITRWSIDDSCETRRVWVEVFGIPPCGWCWENFDKIASLWGRLITLGKAISRTDSFESMKMLIVTDVFNRIDQDVILNLGDGGYRLMIREIGTAVQIVHNDCFPFTNTPIENMDSSGDIPGFEDLQANFEVENDMAQSNVRMEDPSMAYTER